MDDANDRLPALCAAHPGHELMLNHLHTLLTTYPPPFICVHDPATPRLTCAAMKSLLSLLSQAQAPERIAYAQVNAVACFTTRLLYDTVINALAGHTPTWDSGCANWMSDVERWNENFDAFTHGIKAVHRHLSKQASGAAIRMVVAVERAERLKETMPDVIAPLTQLAELAQIDVTVIFISENHWQDLKPSLGVAPDPFYVSIEQLGKQAVLQRLTSTFTSVSSAFASSNSSATEPLPAHAYHPALAPLYAHFVSTLYSVCAPFTQHPDELTYISAARWPGFVQPILDAHAEQNIELSAPSEDVRMRLTRLFTPSLTAALEALYPRTTDALAWAILNAPDPDLLARPHEPGSLTKSRPGSPSKRARDAPDDRVDVVSASLRALPRMSRFLLVASFLASTNPAKTDMRMFGRVSEGKGRKRKGGGTRKPRATAGTAKIPQRLLGPTPFPLDRMLAILGILLEEYDADVRPDKPQYTVPGEYTEMEISRVGVYASIMELTSIRLLHRTSPVDKLDGPPMFKSAISYESAMTLARDLGVPLNDLMWDPA
ncbi:hypothetical protein PUNSTDRAFT_128273 [Punctularia strigosozonata HHB-11173 SS5]|uniref:Origin recognition complex subunit 5 n=1 Tax=Punctularia strigosozonata (strain HHB-11173) TaxID=741275 RepID=R7S3K8_PUNST|nr:uncharacterized protein PUNSTDRAFT_128273 [Punctularia strigosozonata HHB-11173 SS5]EIN04783.1 hypothetical protein PUNSTDRAFT_128273 [Punctularia strigosozonata HHB-11173 SS5]